MMHGEDKSKNIDYEERLINIETSTIEESGDAKYMMNKEAITVLPGDIVRYKITAYNEGNVDGYISEITDYLPDGMELLISDTITNYGIKNYANKQVGILDYDSYNKSNNIVKFKYSTSSSHGKELSKYSGGDDLSSYVQYVECRVTNDVKQGQLLTNVSEITKYGYVDFHGTYIEANKTSVDIDSEEDNVFKGVSPSITSKEEYDENLERVKQLIDRFTGVTITEIDKNFMSIQDDDDFEQVKVGEFDLALRKYISSVNGKELAQSREPMIDAISASKYLSTKTAAYYHTKKPVRVNLGDTITYTIRVYNEGYFAGYAQEITDYLPEGLSYKEDSQINKDNNWVATKNEDGTTTIKTDKLKDQLINPANGAYGFLHIYSIGAVNGELTDADIFWKDVQVECTVNSSGKNGGILTNVAEISSYAYGLVNSNEKGEVPDENSITYVYADKEDVDIDSEQNNVLQKLQENQVEASTVGYYDYQSKTHNISSSTENYYIGLQDDDDFENVEVEPFDLALRKFITKVKDNNIDGDDSREPKITARSLSSLSSTGTAKYYHSKEPITVDRGDTVLYTIRVYNEGYKDGYAKEITDYLPEGLTFKENSQINKDNNWVATKNEDGTTTIKTNKLANELIKASNGTEKYTKLYQSQNGGDKISDDDIFWKDVQVECIVDSIINGKVLVNVAEITNYGYNDAEGNYVEANIEGVDRDSEENNVFNNEKNTITKRITNIDKYYNYQNVNDPEKTYFEGVQDDDDFENIIVKSELPYEFVLNKIGEDGKPLNGSRFTITNGENTIVNNEQINGSKTIKEENAVVNKTYTYTVKENESTNGYVNILGENIIHIATYLNENAKLTLGVYKTSAGTQDTQEDKYYSKYGYYITDKDGKILEDSKTDLYSKITVKVDNNSEIPKINVTVPNILIKGKYDLELIKLDKIDGKTPLEGVKFDVTVKKDGKEVTLYDTNDKTINLKGLTTDKNGKVSIPNIKITEEATYNYEIVETDVPDGYIKLEETIKLTVDTKNENDEYIVKNTKLEGPAEGQFNNNKIVLMVQNGQFDLALRKFITGVTTVDGNKQDVTTRVPVFKIDENGKYVYEHTKEPVLVANQNVVEYTIRVYNEGSIAGYAKEIKDDIPEGLEFLPDDELNKEYRWIMLDEEGNETDDVNKAKYIISDYLSKENEKTAKENLLKPFNEEDYEAGSIKEPDYKEVKVAFKVTMPNTSDEIIINQAQISDDSDEDGNDVTDKDSTPNEWIDGEDDQDIEKIKVQYFDLALRKWVTKAIVIEDGKETVRETGHKAEDDPEAVVKVDLKKSKLDKVVVKFEYQIRVTNEGQIAGSVEEISDYIPEGLKFVAADNPEWEEVEGKVVTDQLAGQIMEPGESKEVTILLTWINREDNMGLKINVAEISKDYNEYGSPDIDSTPNNKVPGEDDIDDAPVMLTVTTGEAVVYIGITIAVLGILAGGVIGIKKFVIK